MDIRSITQGDIGTIQALADRCRPYIVPHVDYNYWMLANYSADYTLLAFDGERAVGYVSGFPIGCDSSSIFVIQICCDPDYRRQGVCSALLEELYERHNVKGRFAVECTINPKNAASCRTFDKLARSHGGTSRWIDTMYEAEIPERGFRVEIGGM